MTAIIVLLLLAVRSLTDSQLLVPLQNVQNYSEFVSFKDHSKTTLLSSDHSGAQDHQENKHDSENVNGYSKQVSWVNIDPEVKSNDCFYPFQTLGSGCYYFSTIMLDFAGAMDYCTSLSYFYGHFFEVTLAMLDFDSNDDIALMSEVASRETTYTVGGYANYWLEWKWVDNRTINQRAQFWYMDEPNTPDYNCLSAQCTTYGNIKKAYLYDSNCEEEYYFICQSHTGCPSDFVLIGNQCYLKSADVGLPDLTWDESREFCRSLSMPEGYYSDLAVLGLPGEDTTSLMNELVVTTTSSGAYDSWLGGYEESDCKFKWTNNNTLPESSFYWLPSEPDCGGDHGVRLYNEPRYNNRVWLADYPKDNAAPFTCQMLKSI